MRNRNASNVVRLLVAALLAALLTSAFAQELDPRGVALLEGLQGTEAPEDIRNLQVTTSSVTYVEGEEFETRSQTVIDYENKRAAIISEVMGMETRMILVDGQTRMNVMGMSMPLPAEAAAQFDSIFEQSSATGLLESAQRITFDGPVNYGDLLVGDQVTYEGDAEMYGTPDTTVLHYVFDASGALLGMHMATNDGAMLMVYSEPVREIVMNHDMSMYMEQNGSWELMQVATIESMEYNAELDESLFQ